MKYTLIAILCLVVVGCSNKESTGDKVVVVEKLADVGQDGRFSEDGEFVYNIQQAHFKANQVKSLGEVTKEQFLEAFSATDWGQQVIQANERKTVSPSMAIRHNPTEYELGITVVGNSAADYGFWLYFGKFGEMKSIEVLDEQLAKPYINMFFEKKYDQMMERFGLVSE